MPVAIHMFMGASGGGAQSQSIVGRKQHVMTETSYEGEILKTQP